MAEALLRAGHRVVLSGTREDALRLSASRVPQAQFRALAADLSDPDAAPALARAAAAAFGRIDILVNAAGISTSAVEGVPPDRPVRLWNIPSGVLERMYRVNVLASLHLAALLAPDMAARGWGRIVNVGTGFGTMLSFGGYGGSKAAVEAETACLAAALSGTGVTANVLLPGGPTATRMTSGFPTPAAEMLQPDIMAAPVLYLASDASAADTGMRFVAKDWDVALPPERAAALCRAPAGWPDLIPRTGPASRSGSPASEPVAGTASST